MDTNPLQELRRCGQSVWLDDWRRDLLTSGAFQRLITQDGIAGLTANPTILEKAIDQSGDYDAALERLLPTGRTPEQIYETLVIEDLQAAADLLRPIYNQTQAGDGYVSLELPPALAGDTQASVVEARRLWGLLNRPNVMIKVPATPAGIPAIATLTGEGINVNVTLLFDVENYVEAARAYLAGLEHLDAEGRELASVASVASFFVSRVDTAVDQELDEQLAATRDPVRQARLRALLGQAGIANARVAYKQFVQLFGEARFARLAARGAQPQRPLWASTSTKNPAYRDVRYVEELIGPDTVNTLALPTLAAFRDHGHVARTVDADVEAARQVLKELRSVGVDLAAVTRRLQRDGVEQFAASFERLRATIARKQAACLPNATATVEGV